MIRVMSSLIRHLNHPDLPTPTRHRPETIRHILVTFNCRHSLTLRVTLSTLRVIHRVDRGIALHTLINSLSGVQLPSHFAVIVEVIMLLIASVAPRVSLVLNGGRESICSPFAG